MLSENDESLIERCLKGDTGAFEQLVDRYQQKVFNIAYRMSGNREDALDLSQESFLRAYKALKRFRGQSSFGTWLFRITNNTCIDELRRKKRQPQLVVSTDAVIKTEDGEYQFEVPDSPDETPEALALTQELKNQIQQALQNLSEEHRAALVLRDVEGYSYEEIADILQLNLGTVKSRINRARLALRQELSGMEQNLENRRLKVQEGG